MKLFCTYILSSLFSQHHIPLWMILIRVVLLAYISTSFLIVWAFRYLSSLYYFCTPFSQGNILFYKRLLSITWKEDNISADVLMCGTFLIEITVNIISDFCYYHYFILLNILTKDLYVIFITLIKDKFPMLKCQVFIFQYFCIFMFQYTYHWPTEKWFTKNIIKW